MKSFRKIPYSNHERTTLRRVIRCQLSASSSSLHRTRSNLRFHLRRFKAAYGRRFYWQIRWYNVPYGLRATLARLRWCESTNNPRATNGSHWGYYQYDVATWQEAQSWAGVPASRRTARADYASPIMQNVVTASFYPSHRGRWACSA